MDWHASIRTRDRRVLQYGHGCGDLEGCERVTLDDTGYAALRAALAAAPAGVVQLPDSRTFVPAEQAVPADQAG